MAAVFESGFFVKKAAWHRGGTVFDRPPSIEEVLPAAGLDWEVELQPLYLADGRENPWSKAVVRMSDAAILGSVGNGFHPWQNREAVAWLQPLIESGELVIEAAGSLEGGRRIWLLARLAGCEGVVGRDDPIRQYFGVMHGHGGNLAIHVFSSKTRVVCWNTSEIVRSTVEAQTGAETDHSQGFVLKHSKNVKVALEVARRSFDAARQTFQLTLEDFELMRGFAVNHAKLKAYVAEVFEATDKEKMPRCWERVRRAFEIGPGAREAGDTLWGAFNAVTYWTDHERGRSPETRLASSWLGESARTRQRAYDVAGQMLAHAL